MDELIETVQRRFEHLSEHPNDASWSVLAGVAVFLTLFFVYAQVAITYTHGSLVGTLAMVENTSPTAIIRKGDTKDGLPAYTDEPDAPPPSYVEEEVLLLTPTPITASNCGTVRHLKRIGGGRRARFRGLGIAIMYSLASQYLSWGLHAVSGARGPFGASISFIVAHMLLFRVNMLWTHVVISAPSSVRLRDRMVPWHRAKKAIMPTLGWALVQVAIPFALMVLVQGLGIERLVQKIDRTARLEEAEVLQLAASVVAVFGAAALLLVCVYTPVNVALTRCQASLLADDETPIVPLDRTFGGRVDPENPAMRLRSAWDSFDWNSRVRLLKVYVKTVAFQILATFAYVFSIVAVAAFWVAL